MKTKKIRYIGFVIKDQDYWYANERVKFTPAEYTVGYKTKKYGSEWAVLRKENVKFITKEETVITKEITETLI